MAAAVTLQMAALCEELGLTAEAAAWLELAAPETWLNAEQQSEAAQQVAIQQLVAQILQQSVDKSAQAAAACTANLSVTSGGAGQDSSTNPSPQPSAFLLAAVQQAEPGTVQTWLCSINRSSSSSSSTGAATAAGNTSHGAWRPASAGRLRLSQLQGTCSAAAAAAAGEDAVLRGRVMWLRPSAPQACLLAIARYLADHGQFTPAVQLCTTALELAR